MKHIIIFVQSPKVRGFISLQHTFPQITQKVLTHFTDWKCDNFYSKLSKNITLEENLQEK